MKVEVKDFKENKNFKSGDLVIFEERNKRTIILVTGVNDTRFSGVVLYSENIANRKYGDYDTVWFKNILNHLKVK